MQLKTIIVDDEKLSITLLNAMLADLCPQISVIAEASDPDDALEAINRLHPDVVFTDIEMSGINILDHLNQVYPTQSFQTVYVTGYSKYSINALKSGAVDYLLKPVESDELKSTVSK